MIERPKRPDPSPRDLQRFQQVSQLRLRMDLDLHFDRPVSRLKANETARRLLDALDLSAPSFEKPDELGEASLKCAPLRRILRIRL